jgi:hypothetical protein
VIITFINRAGWGYKVLTGRLFQMTHVYFNIAGGKFWPPYQAPGFFQPVLHSFGLNRGQLHLLWLLFF